MTGLNKNGTISVTFNQGLKGDKLAVVLAHEGTHVADDQSWITSRLSFTSTELNHFQLEQHAWNVSSFTAQALNLRANGAGEWQTMTCGAAGGKLPTARRFEREALRTY